MLESLMRLSTRLIVLLLVSNLLAIFWAGLQLYDNVDHELEEVLQAKLKTSALSLLDATRDLALNDEAVVETVIDAFIAADNDWLRQFLGGTYHAENSDLLAKSDISLVSVLLLDGEGKQIYHTPGTENFSFIFPGESGFNVVDLEEFEWLVHGRIDSTSGLTVFVAHRDDLSLYVSSEIVGDFVREFAILLPLIILAIGISVYLGLRPLTQLSSEIRDREANNLSAINLKGKLPLEIQSFVYALNNLFQRLNNTFERERRFTSDAAHELRTPLAIIKTQADLLSSSDSLEEAHGLGRQLTRSTDRLSSLLSQLLMLARTEIEARQLELETVDLNEMLTDVVSSCVINTADRHEIVFDGQVTARIRCYPPLAMQLFSNLIGNAVKYSPAHTEIQIIVSRVGEASVCISIGDRGCGVPDSDLEHIFQRFYRTERSRDKVDGAGLGLSIVRAIVVQHGWEISAHNRDSGGFKVLVTIPLV